MDKTATVDTVDCGTWGEYKTTVLQYLFGDGLFQRGDYLFRGQRDGDWELITSYDRWFESTGLPERERISVAAGLLAEFQREIKHGGDTSLSSASDDELVALAQHYGLPTRLLDWTESPYIGALFAFADTPTVGDPGGQVAVWALDTRSHIWTSELGVQIIPMEAKSNTRLRNQEGRFTFSRTPFRSLEEYARHCSGLKTPALLRFLIPASERRLALADLEAMGITPAKMFPDLQGYAVAAKLRQTLKHCS